MVISRRQKANGSKEQVQEQRGKLNFFGGMNLIEIKELIDLITEKGITEFELERSGIRLKISRNNTLAHHPEVLVQTVDSPAATSAGNSSAPPVNSGNATSTLSEAEAAAEAAPDGRYTVHSPMVGTFYSSATHGEALFVQVGDTVQPGQVLCIIEAMKLMNEIEAEVAGEVLKCYVENGQPVEYGEPLFDLRPLAASKKGS